MNILITGGAGYIGSHVAKQILEETNFNLTIIDNLSTGKYKTIAILKEIRKFSFFDMDLKEFNDINLFLSKNNFDTIFHFAASIIVEESTSNPLKYYLNNTVNTTNLIDSALKNDVKKFIFSSTAAVYGDVQNKDIPIKESYPTSPINPYGMSKLMSEKMLLETKKIKSDFKFVIFRYFNVAGADIHYENQMLRPRIGQYSEESTHLLKIASECACKKRDSMKIYGEDYLTPDKTCIRDYIHIDDLATAHILAINYLEKYDSDIFNIGYNKGYSVKEVINSMKKVSKHNFNVMIERRRKGDSAVLIADNQKIKNLMNWEPKYDNIEKICESAYIWEKQIHST